MVVAYAAPAMRLWLFSILLVGLTACSTTPDSPPRPTSTPEPAHLAVGQEARLWARQGSEWYLSETAVSQDAYAKAVAAKDEIGLQELIRKERIVPVANGTKLLVIEQGWYAMKVRVLEGPQYGKAGWIAFEHIR